MIEENKNCWLTGQCNKVDCDSFCLRFYKLNYLYDLAMIPLAKRYHVGLRPDADGTDEHIFATTLQELSKNIQEFVESGKNLFIYSKQCGNGKTSIALRLIEAYFNKIWPSTQLACRALFINVPKLLLELKANIKEPSSYVKHITENILTADLVVWDDIGEKNITEFEGTNLYTFIDQRLYNGKANIFTSNIVPEEMYNILGDRLASRVVTSSIKLELKGKDKRGLVL